MVLSETWEQSGTNEFNDRVPEAEILVLRQLHGM